MLLRAYSKPPRKTRAIVVLCEHIIKNVQKMPMFSADNVKDWCAVRNFGERRAYDILSIFKSLGLIFKKDLDTYVWLGYQGMVDRVRELRFKGFQYSTGRYALATITNVCLMMLINRMSGLSNKEMIAQLSKLGFMDTTTLHRRVYDVMNIFKAFPDLLEEINKY